MIELGILIRLVRLLSVVTRTIRTVWAAPKLAVSLTVLLSAQINERRLAGR